MKLLANLRYPLAGWIAGILTVLALTAIWPAFFPGISNEQHYDTPPIATSFILIVTLVIATPAAIIGGFIGSRLPREGGSTEQTLVAVVVGAILAVPFACMSLWLLSGP